MPRYGEGSIFSKNPLLFFMSSTRLEAHSLSSLILSSQGLDALRVKVINLGRKIALEGTHFGLEVLLVFVLEEDLLRVEADLRAYFVRFVAPKVRNLSPRPS